MSTTYQDFLQKYPAYESTRAIDTLRASDYSRLDRLGQVYLDYTGGGLYADSQVRQHQEILRGLLWLVAAVTVQFMLGILVEHVECEHFGRVHPPSWRVDVVLAGNLFSASPAGIAHARAG